MIRITWYTFYWKEGLGSTEITEFLRVFIKGKYTWRETRQRWSLNSGWNYRKKSIGWETFQVIAVMIIESGNLWDDMKTKDLWLDAIEILAKHIQWDPGIFCLNAKKYNFKLAS